MANTVLGKVSVVPRGDYSASTTYYALDIVGYNGGSYLAMQQVTGVTPSNDGVNWMQLSGPGLPGEQGPQGNPGAAAGFGEATATVDDTSGTPSVEVETSGPDTAKVFTFKFYGLKGTKGDTGDKGNTGDTGPVGPQGVSVVTAQINEQGHLIITLSEGEPIDAGDATGPIGPQGIQGEAGESVGSIQRTSGTGAPGTTDTYTMYSTDGSQIGTFTVYNGTNGTGAGDFMADGSVPMTGALDMGGQRVTNVGAPTAPTDAVRQSDLEAISDEIDHILDGTTPVTVPVATEIKAGIVKPGEGMSVTEDGTLNVDDQLPAGGQTGQVLTKTESGEAWQDAPDGLPAGGETGQVLTKTADGSAWKDAPSGLPDGGVPGQTLYKSGSGTEWGNPVGKADQNSPDSTGEIFNDYERNEATGEFSHAEGWFVIASGMGSHAEGERTEASGSGSHAEGMFTTASGDEAHSEGVRTVASGNYSHVEGANTVASGMNQHVQGKYNIEDNSDTYAHIVGNGESENTRSNAHTLDWDGNAWFAGDVYVGGTSQSDGDKLMHEPSGGTAGQILEKTATGTQWADKPASGMSQSEADARYLQLSGGTMTGALALPGNPTSDNQAANKAYVDALKPNRLTAVLSASGWSGNSQTITVNGVITNTSAQDIDISCADKASADAWAAGGVWCSNPTRANKLTFTCTTPPTANINLNIRLWEVG